jgi:hypothetical protein
MGGVVTVVKSDEKLLREAVRQILNEEFYDYGVQPWFGPYGIGKGASKHSKTSSSYGVPGGSLYGIFIQPFLDAAKVVGSEIGQTGVRLVGVLRTMIESALEALLPKFKANYDAIQNSQQKYIDKIKEKYDSAYKAIDEAWEHEDIQFFSFMHDPTTWLSYKMITAKPEAALSVYEMLAEGNSALLNYLRDIRNRLYGAQSPGSGVPVQPVSVATEGRLLESDKAIKKIDFQGLKIYIDRPKGFVQKGTNNKGEKWERVYLYDYGFIKGTEGGDGEDLDVFVGQNKDSSNVYLVTQKHLDGSFDEYKAFVGFESEDEALEAYEAHIPTKFFEDICVIPVGALKGLVGLDPDVELKEAVKPVKKQPTPAELVATALTDSQFVKMLSKLPIVQGMKRDAATIEQNSAAELDRVMAPILNADTAEDLVRASNGSWNPPQEYVKLQPEEKAKLDEVLVKQAQASMAAYYSSRINELVAQLLKLGVSENSSYINSLKQRSKSLAHFTK